MQADTKSAIVHESSAQTDSAPAPLHVLQAERTAAPPHDAKPRVDNRQRGFTLTELMVVIFIIGLLTTIVLINVLPSQDRAMVTKAQADIAILEQALEIYRLENLTYPTTAEGLNALLSAPTAPSSTSSTGSAGSASPTATFRRGGYIKRLPSDPWGRPYQYQAPAPDGSPYAIWSYGADGVPGGDAENADIHGSF